MEESVRLTYGKKNKVVFVLGIILISYALVERATYGLSDIFGTPILNIGIVVLISSFAIEFMRLYRHSPIKKELIAN